MSSGSPSMSDFQLGDMIGRGASGMVYRALNFSTGETVAIKSISLLSLEQSLLPDIMSEIHLLKNLNHPNIVKYKGFVQDKENLFIILEYCENGSLQTVLKKYGKFPEHLVGKYIRQVLEGLIYLHEQGVIHRDIKGANILAVKDGRVKLADFGVSSKTTPRPHDATISFKSSQSGSLSTSTSTDLNGARKASGGSNGRGGHKQDNDNEVVGSPYWMAPEVIEQNGATTASDIWSVGCVVVELLEGKPPYGDLVPLQALFRIVQDESMRIPETASPAARDFLTQCFQKDPNLRISAKKLLLHPWIAAEEVKPIPKPRQIPLERPQSAQNDARSTSSVPRTPSGNPSKAVALRPKINMAKAEVSETPFEHDVQGIQEWNDALNASPKASGTLRKLPVKNAQPRKISSRTKPSSIGFFPLPTRSSAEAIAPKLSSSSHPNINGPAGHARQLSNGDPGRALLQKSLQINQALSRAQNDDESNWDDDFSADELYSKLGRHGREPAQTGYSAVEEVDHSTIRPSASSAVIKSKPAALPTLKEINDSAEGSDDFSEFDGVDDGLAGKIKQFKLKNKTHRGILHPDDLHKGKPLVPQSSRTSTGRVPSTPQRGVSDSAKSNPPISHRSSHSTTLSPASSRNTVPARSPPSSRQNSLRGEKAEQSETLKELQKYIDKDEEEDYDAMVADGVDVITLNSIKSRHSMKMSSRHDSSGPDRADSHDPFADFEEDLAFEKEDIEVKVLRDKKATLCANVDRIVDLLEPTTSLITLKNACEDLLGMIDSTPELGLQSHFVASHGMLAVLELLESRLSREVSVRLLKIVNTIVINDIDALESFCLVGGIPVIIPFTSKKHSLDCRLEASIFIQQLTGSALTLQMFISCRGLRILVELLDEDYSENKDLILSSLEGISSVFELQSPTPRNDFCRMFVREGVLDPMSTALLSILKDDMIGEEIHSARAIGVLLLFCQAAQADSKVREAFATRTILTRLLKACESLSPKLLVTAVKAIKHLSTGSQLIEVLQNSNAMEILVSILGKSIKGPHANEICSHIFQTIYSMTRLSKARQEEAASSGIIPLLKRVIVNESPLKQFVLPILCDMASAGKVSRRLLWQNDGMELYLDLLSHPYWRVSALDSILAWMSDETARVEDVLVEQQASNSIVDAFVQASGASFEGILDPLAKIMRLSTSVTNSLSTPPFVQRLAESLSQPHPAAIKLNLLRLTRIMCDNHPERAALVSKFNLAKIVERLAKQDDAILVRELAKEIYPSLLFGNEPPPIPLTSTAFHRPHTPSSSSTSRSIASGSSVATSSASAHSSSSYSSGGSRVRGSGIGTDRPQRVLSTVSKSVGDNGSISTATSRYMGESAKSPKPRDLPRVTISPAPIGKSGEERPMHKRKISKNYIDMQWQPDGNGKLRGVRGPPQSQPG